MGGGILMNDHLKRLYTLIESFKKNIDYMKAPKNKQQFTAFKPLAHRPKPMLAKP